MKHIKRDRGCGVFSIFAVKQAVLVAWLLLTAVLSLSIMPYWAVADIQLAHKTTDDLKRPPLLTADKIIDASLDDSIYYFADQQGLDITSIMDNADYFIPLRQKPISFLATSQWYWLRLHNTREHAAKWFVSTGVATPPLLRVYWQGTPATGTTAYRPLLRQLVLGYPNPLSSLELQPGEAGNLLIEYQSLANFPLTIRIYDTESLSKKGRYLNVISGAYLGALGILFLFFFSQFAINRRPVYFYYSMFVFLVIFTVMQIVGIDFGLADKLQPRYQTLLTIMLGGITYTFYFLFATKFFQFRQHNPFLHRVLVGLAVMVLVLAMLAFIKPLDYLLSVVVAIGLPWPIVGAVWALRQQYPSAIFFLAGSTVHCISIYFLLLACLGFERSGNNFLFPAACIGLILDILCFAVAIIYHGNKVRLEYNRQLQERIKDLDSLVESEQVSAKALALSRQAVLNMAATAHDIQQPLSSMQLLLSLQPATDALNQNIHNALNYARALLDSVLGDARHNYLMVTESVDARKLLTDVVARHQYGSANQFLSLKVHCPSTDIMCFPLVVQRILDNLVSNAFKYTATGKILVGGRKRKDGSFVIQVWDTGTGMNDVQIGKLLKPFVRKDTDEISGYGLGLFIVKSLCQQAAYPFFIRSMVGRGSCFSVQIPHALGF